MVDILKEIKERAKETLKEFMERLEKEGKVICDFDRLVGKDPVTGQDVEMIIIKTCPKRSD